MLNELSGRFLEVNEGSISHLKEEKKGLLDGFGDKTEQKTQQNVALF